MSMVLSMGMSVVMYVLMSMGMSVQCTLYDVHCTSYIGTFLAHSYTQTYTHLNTRTCILLPCRTSYDKITHIQTVHPHEHTYEHTYTYTHAYIHT